MRRPLSRATALSARVTGAESLVFLDTVLHAVRDRIEVRLWPWRPMLRGRGDPWLTLAPFPDHATGW